MRLGGRFGNADLQLATCCMQPSSGCYIPQRFQDFSFSFLIKCNLPLRLAFLFHSGNRATLLEEPKAKGLDPCKAVVDFHEKHYSANICRSVTPNLGCWTTLTPPEGTELENDGCLLVAPFSAFSVKHGVFEHTDIAHHPPLKQTCGVWPPLFGRAGGHGGAAIYCSAQQAGD